MQLLARLHLGEKTPAYDMPSALRGRKKNKAAKSSRFSSVLMIQTCRVVSSTESGSASGQVPPKCFRGAYYSIIITTGIHIQEDAFQCL